MWKVYKHSICNNISLNLLGTNYHQLISLAEAQLKDSSTATQVITKDCLKGLLTLAQSDREKKLIRCSVYKASGLSSTAARKQLGLEQMNEHWEHVEECIDAAKNIREAIHKISAVR